MTLIATEEYTQFVDFVDNYTTAPDQLNEIMITLSAALRKKIQFIRVLAKKTKYDFVALLKLFKNSKIFTVFSKIGWDFTKLWKTLKKGFEVYGKVFDIISDFIRNHTGDSNTVLADKIDNMLQDHPYIKKLSGVLVSALIAYIWFNMSFIGNVKSDFDMDQLIKALSGDFKVSDVFGKTAGTKFIVLFIIGTVSEGLLSFPWPGAATGLFIGAILVALAFKTKIKLTKSGLDVTFTVNGDKIEVKETNNTFNLLTKL